ncbi:MAG: 3-phosphoglycerate dehydrogenase [Tenericutes bacterium GWF2_57_13]|nr:MAG: 3-phosphoglycerate dehydrogenase [Tenericutes bacterium GWF2_57_13]
MKVLTLNQISPVGLNRLPAGYELTKDPADADLILVRSAVMHDMVLPKQTIAVARAGAGVNNIPLDVFAKQGVVVFNTPGANANAVKELVIAGMLLATRDIFGGIAWVKANQTDPEIAKTVEKAKAAYGGTEILGKTIGVIGLGAVGYQVANSCHALGMKVIGYDAFLSEAVKSRLHPDVVIAKTLDELYSVSDFITVHVPLLPDTKGMINAKTIALMKDGVIILNFARDILVDDAAIKVAIEAKKVRKYVTDFPNPASAAMDGVIAIPHLGASTEEAEDNCAAMAVDQLVNYVSTGSITNSVNYPFVDFGPKHRDVRVLIHHASAVSGEQLDKILSGIRVTKVKGEIGYTAIDVPSADEATLKTLETLPGVVRIRVI